jgi:predicted  nucleic acid-binding Zn-ribbon protein
MKTPLARVGRVQEPKDPAADIEILNQLSAVHALQSRRAAGRDSMLRLLTERQALVERLTAEIEVERKRTLAAGESTVMHADSERAHESVVGMERALDRARADLALSTAEAAPRIEAAADEVASLERRAHHLASGLSTEASRIYLSLSRARRAPFAATLSDGCCDGCNMRLPSGLLGEIRRTAGLYRCPFCKRVVSDRAATSV